MMVHLINIHMKILNVVYVFLINIQVVIDQMNVMIQNKLIYNVNIFVSFLIVHHSVILINDVYDVYIENFLMVDFLNKFTM